MKLTKLSLVAALLVGSSAFAFENTKTSGDAKFFYATDDSGASSLFTQSASAGQAALGLGVTSDITKTIKGAVHLTALSTLGLEGQLVGKVWEGTTADSYWIDTVNLSADFDKTNVIVGRMALDTPLVFTETWSIAHNTFEAAVLTNTDLPDTKIIAAYVGGANDGQSGGIAGTGYGKVTATTTLANTNFHQFYDGAYTLGAQNNSWKPLKAELWYYNLHKSSTVGVQAYWLQADLDIEGLILGAQYTGGTSSSKTGATTTDTALSAYAVKAGYEMKDMLSVSIAYSQTGTDSAAGGNLSGQGQSKLYTETWWSSGNVAQKDTSAMNLTFTSPVSGMFDFGLYYTLAAQDKAAVPAATKNLAFSELTLEFAKKFGNLETTLAYINTTNEIANGTGATAVNTIQGYLTYNFK